ncbi:unnamed protein product [Moneuplotes crassus]|uniref:Uncharacterized protein n=1 Tax=Euplotes crassus TaxID=5936 RepID=A0AAD1UHD5_EUPCR|nr:unnamed protein product [Moneuplotes crassus]
MYSLWVRKILTSKEACLHTSLQLLQFGQPEHLLWLHVSLTSTKFILVYLALPTEYISLLRQSSVLSYSRTCFTLKCTQVITFSCSIKWMSHSEYSACSLRMCLHGTYYVATQYIEVIYVGQIRNLEIIFTIFIDIFVFNCTFTSIDIIGMSILGICIAILLVVKFI